MRTIVIRGGIILVLAGLAPGIAQAAEPAQRRSSSFHDTHSRKKAEPEPVRTQGYAQVKRRAEGSKGSCPEARFKAAASALELAHRAQELRMCASIGDLSEGCSLEYERVRGAHESFESAVIAAGGCV